ncbi:MAG: flavodoxin family protein [Methanobacterium sp.]
MKIGIIVHSQTDHTYSVAQNLQKKLTEAGNDIEIKRVMMVGGDRPEGKNVQIENPPDVSQYDALIFGGPVHAFSLAPAMKVYLEQIPSLQDKKIALFVTKGLRFEWTGGTRAIGQMKKICQSKGGMIMGTGIIIWNKQRDKKIAEVVEKFNTIF